MQRPGASKRGWSEGLRHGPHMVAVGTAGAQVAGHWARGRGCAVQVGGPTSSGLRVCPLGVLCGLGLSHARALSGPWITKGHHPGPGWSLRSRNRKDPPSTQTCQNVSSGSRRVHAFPGRQHVSLGSSRGVGYPVRVRQLKVRGSPVQTRPPTSDPTAELGSLKPPQVGHTPGRTPGVPGELCLTVTVHRMERTQSSISQGRGTGQTQEIPEHEPPVSSPWGRGQS